MRVIALKIGDQQVDLHPSVTVLGGLAPAQQNYLVASLERMLNGDGNALDGQFECHQLIASITPTHIDALSLPDGLAVVVRAQELPGSTLGEYEPAFESHISDLRAQLDISYDESHQLEVRYGEARQHTQSATIELEAALAQLDTAAPADFQTARVALEELLAQKSLEANALPSTHDDEDSELGVALSALSQQVSALNVALEDDRLALLEQFEQLEAKELELAELAPKLANSEPAGPVTAGESESDEVDTTQDDDVVNNSALSSEDCNELLRMVEKVENYRPTVELVSHPEAAALADRWRELQAEEAALLARLRDEGLDLDTYDTQISKVEAEIEVLEKQTRRHQVSPELEDEIERLNAAIDDTGGWPRLGRRSKRVQEQAREELDAVLAEAGFPTYAAYIMARVAPTINHAALGRLAVAKEQLRELHATRQEVKERLRQDTRLKLLHRAVNDVREAALALLPATETDDRLEQVLRAVRIENPAAIETISPVDQLRVRLSELGIEYLADEPVALIEAAKAAVWSDRENTSDSVGVPANVDNPVEAPLAEAIVDDIAKRTVVDPELLALVAALENEVENLKARILVADNELASKEERYESLMQEIERLRHESELVARKSDTAVAAASNVWEDHPDVHSAKEWLRLAEARLEAHEQAKVTLQTAENKLQQARRNESINLTVKRSADEKLRRLQQELDEVLERAPLPAVSWHDDGNLPSEIEWYLLGKVSALRKASFVGSIPLVLNDAFRGLSSETISQVGAGLRKVSETSQVIYIGNSPEMISWAASQPIGAAALVEVSGS